MIKEHDVLQLIIETYPQARAALVQSADYWIPERGPISAHTLLSNVVHCVVEHFIATNYENAEELFALIETFITEGEETVANAACTCFVESLQNLASSDGEFEYSHFVSLLGPKAVEHAKAWDAFTGAKTDGL